MRASGPFSVGRSIPYLLLNPPSGIFFKLPFVFSVAENVAHFFPSHSLHLDLTFLALPFMLTIFPSQGKLTTVVYRRVKQRMVRFNGGYQF